MKLALIISSLSAGGAERVISLLASHWAARGDEVSLITIDGSATDCYPLDTRVARIALDLKADSDGFFTAVANNARRLAALRAALKNTGARFVISFGEFTNVQVLIATRFAGVRCVVSERTDPFRHRVGVIWRVMRRLTYPMADALVVQTNALLPWARSTVGKKRAHVVANPVRDMRQFRAVKRMPECIAAGRLVPAKGFDILLDAFAAIAHEAPEWRLVILGEGPERDRLAAQARRLGIAERVSMRGWLAEPGAALAQASVYVLSSHYEGFPNALLEAMACGLPAVATACRGPAEIIQDEVDGLLVEAGSAPQLAAAMLRLMKDETLRLKLGRNAERVAFRYKLESIVHRWDLVLGVAAAHAGATLRPNSASPQ